MEMYQLMIIFRRTSFGIEQWRSFQWSRPTSPTSPAVHTSTLQVDWTESSVDNTKTIPVYESNI